MDSKPSHEPSRTQVTRQSFPILPSHAPFQRCVGASPGSQEAPDHIGAAPAGSDREGGQACMGISEGWGGASLPKLGGEGDPPLPPTSCLRSFPSNPEGGAAVRPNGVHGRCALHQQLQTHRSAGGGKCTNFRNPDLVWISVFLFGSEVRNAMKATIFCFAPCTLES